MTSSEFFYGVLDLFSSALSAVLAEPVFAFLAAAPVLLAALALFGAMVRGVRR